MNMNINISDQVSVILTQHGADRLNEINKKIKEKAPNYVFNLYQEGDEYRTQLWSLFDEFGDLMHIASVNLPFKNNEIKVIC